MQDDKAWNELVGTSFAYLRMRQDAIARDFSLGQHERWDWNQDRAELVFSNAGKPVVVCDIVFVGSLSRKSNTWLWSWANDSLVDGVKTPMLELRDFGEQRNFERLAGAHWAADEVDAWEMTAIAAKYFGAIGSYRAPDESGFVHMVITDARWVRPSPRRRA